MKSHMQNIVLKRNNWLIRLPMCTKANSWLVLNSSTGKLVIQPTMSSHWSKHKGPTTNSGSNKTQPTQSFLHPPLDSLSLYRLSDTSIFRVSWQRLVYFTDILQFSHITTEHTNILQKPNRPTHARVTLETNHNHSNEQYTHTNTRTDGHSCIACSYWK